jgi:hypothetical protein
MQQVFLVDRVEEVLTVLLVGLEDQVILLQQVLLKEIMVEMDQVDRSHQYMVEVEVEVHLQLVQMEVLQLYHQVE